MSDVESAGESQPDVPDSPQSIGTSPPPSAITSPCSSIGSQVAKRGRAVPSLSAIAAAQNRSRQRSDETENTAATTSEACTIRDLILDKKSGLWSKSALERRKKRSRKNADDESMQSAVRSTPSPSQTEESAPQQPRIAPQVRIVDGKIVLDHSSLTFSSGPSTAGFQLPILDEGQDGQAINSASFRKNRPAQHRWDQASTAKFYAALSKYGTDFETISRLFQGLTRRHIKNKFKLEERKNRHKVDAALLNRMPIDLNDFPEPEPQPEKVDESENVEVDEDGREIVDETSVHADSGKEDNALDSNDEQVGQAVVVNSDDDEALIAAILA